MNTTRQEGYAVNSTMESSDYNFRLKLFTTHHDPIKNGSNVQQGHRTMPPNNFTFTTSLSARGLHDAPKGSTDIIQPSDYDSNTSVCSDETVMDKHEDTVSYFDDLATAKNQPHAHDSTNLGTARTTRPAESKDIYSHAMRTFMQPGHSQSLPVIERKVPPTRLTTEQDLLRIERKVPPATRLEAEQEDLRHAINLAAFDSLPSWRTKKASRRKAKGRTPRRKVKGRNSTDLFDRSKNHQERRRSSLASDSSNNKTINAPQPRNMDKVPAPNLTRMQDESPILRTKKSSRRKARGRNSMDLFDSTKNHQERRRSSINARPRNMDKESAPNLSRIQDEPSVQGVRPTGAACTSKDTCDLKLRLSSTKPSMTHRSQASSNMKQHMRTLKMLQLRGYCSQSNQSAPNQANALSQSRSNSMDHAPRDKSHPSLEVDRTLASAVRQVISASQQTSKRPTPKTIANTTEEQESSGKPPYSFTELDDWLEHCRDPVALSMRATLREGRRDPRNPVVQDPSHIYNPYEDKEFMMEYEAEMKYIMSPEEIK